jgi:hypothetical protein
MGLLRYEHRADGPRRRVSIAVIREGLEFVWKRQVILGAMSLDMFAVVFGGAKGLLPIYAKDILEVGGFGYGLLLASLEIGAFLMSLVIVFRPPIYRTGRALVYSVAAFGLLTMAFGLSRDIYLSIGGRAARPSQLGKSGVHPGVEPARRHGVGLRGRDIDRDVRGRERRRGSGGCDGSDRVEAARALRLSH